MDVVCGCIASAYDKDYWRAFVEVICRCIASADDGDYWRAFVDVICNLWMY